ncbi:MAG: TraB/GumN family protein [Flavobacteriaceae bacterium]|nr:TraB/GumN family protein [Flavobacteriaceae bacterium]
MKILFYILVITIATQFQSKAQQLENSLLWEISGNNIKESSYLFGTIHMTCDASLNEKVQKAMNKTELLVLELDMDAPDMQSKMMQGVAMKDAKTIKELTTEVEYKLLNDFIKEQTGIPLTMLNTFKPFFIHAMLYPKLLDCSSQSIEAELMKIAASQNEEILGLETVQEQLNVFDEIPYKDQLKDLLNSAKDNMKKDKYLISKMMKIYKSENLNALMKLMQDEKSSFSAKHSDKLLDQRNMKWISKIEVFVKNQATFFGVGAGHLGGDFGVIKLLRKQGYTVKAVL